MKTRVSTSVARIVLAAVTALAAGCYSGPKPYDPDTKQEVYGVSVRKYAPQPVYKRTRLVHLPAPLPPLKTAQKNAPLILPVMHLDLQDTTLEEAAKILAQSARYSVYCASTVADRRISLTSLGTVDELAFRISSEAGVEAIVDHHNREVRFLAQQRSVEPKLFDQKVEEQKVIPHEHQ